MKPLDKKDLFAIDLFAGAGGLSLGFEQAGFSIPLVIEKDDWAADTYENNRENISVTRTDITQVDDSFFSNFTGVDAIIGGPPCQGFSISASNRRKEDDPRNYLYRDFLRAVRVIKPRVVFMENVKEIVKYRLPTGELLVSDIVRTLELMDYKVSYHIVNAANYGVPQERIRFFLIATKGFDIDISNLETFHTEQTLFQTNSHRTIWDAISDLPEVVPRKLDENDILEYDKEPQNEYQQEMRNKSSKIFNHIPMKHTDRTIEKFKLIDVKGTVENIPEEYRSRQRGNSAVVSEKVYSQNHRRIDSNKPSPTITASFYSSFIHPYQHRNLTVREAARIQSFPDYYKFYGKRTTLSKKLLEKKGIYEDLHLDQFNQVGNAVPPLLAKSFAEHISKYL